jgi:hypothetical protein
LKIRIGAETAQAERALGVLNGLRQRLGALEQFNQRISNGARAQSGAAVAAAAAAAAVRCPPRPPPQVSGVIYRY